MRDKDMAAKVDRPIIEIVHAIRANRRKRSQDTEGQEKRRLATLKAMDDPYSRQLLHDYRNYRNDVNYRDPK